MYQEIKPSKRINHVIDTFWTFSKNKSKENFKVLPDTCADLIFDLKQNKIFLSGIMTKYQPQELATDSDLIGIRFKVENFRFLHQIPLELTKNLRLELSEIVPAKNLKGLNRLPDLRKTTCKIDFLEELIGTEFIENPKREDYIVLSAAKKIRSLKGIVNIKDLAKSNHLSLRQLERRFKSNMGLTIKEFSNIVRFNNAKESIATFTKSSLLEIAFDMGFFDHSHMTYEFQRISGENPSFFR